MNRLYSVLTVVAVVLIAMGFASANAGNRVTLNLGLFTLYQVPVTFVAFSGLFVGMLAMFATGIHSDLKVRRILRERLAEEARREQIWIDRSQQDLFDDHSPKAGAEKRESPPEEIAEGVNEEPTDHAPEEPAADLPGVPAEEGTGDPAGGPDPASAKEGAGDWPGEDRKPS